MRGGGFAGEAIQTTFAYAKCIIVCSSHLGSFRESDVQYCLSSINIPV